MGRSPAVEPVGRVEIPADFEWAHRSLREFGGVVRASRHRLGFVSLGGHPPRLEALLAKVPGKFLRHLLRQGWLHLRLACAAWRQRDCDLVIVLEFHALHMLLAVPLLAPLRRRLAFIMHGTQQLATRSRLRRMALGYFKFFGFTGIQAEIPDTILPLGLRLDPARMFVIPLPIIPRVEPRLPPGERLPEGRKIKVGVVGMLREGKPTARLLAFLAPLLAREFPECELVAGAPLFQVSAALQALGVPITDTTEEEDYFALLSQIDVAVNYHERGDYFYRSSGTIADAASAGCHVLCMDLPVLRAQVSAPVRVGTTFSELDDLPRALRAALQQVREHGQDAHWEYRAARHAAAIAAKIDAFLDEQKTRQPGQ